MFEWKKIWKIVYISTNHNLRFLRVWNPSWLVHRDGIGTCDWMSCTSASAYIPVHIFWQSVFCPVSYTHTCPVPFCPVGNLSRTEENLPRPCEKFWVEYFFLYVLSVWFPRKPRYPLKVFLDVEKKNNFLKFLSPKRTFSIIFLDLMFRGGGRNLVLLKYIGRTYKICT